MSACRMIVLSAAILAVAGCNPFRRSPAVEMSGADEILNSRWNGTFAGPASLAGAVQMSGTATMASSGTARMTHVTLELSDATPGGEHPWAAPGPVRLRRGAGRPGDVIPSDPGRQ